MRGVTSLLERDLRGELKDSRIHRTGRQTEWVRARLVLYRQLRNLQGGSSSRRRDCCIRVAHDVHIAAIRHVETFGDELKLRTAEQTNVLCDARIERELARQAERIARETGHLVVARVAVVVQIER